MGFSANSDSLPSRGVRELQGLGFHPELAEPAVPGMGRGTGGFSLIVLVCLLISYEAQTQGHPVFKVKPSLN